jgi:hypothetical protein
MDDEIMGGSTSEMNRRKAKRDRGHKSKKMTWEWRSFRNREKEGYKWLNKGMGRGRSPIGKERHLGRGMTMKGRKWNVMIGI